MTIKIQKSKLVLQTQEAYDKALATRDQARAACEQALEAYHKALAACDQARAAYSKDTASL